MAKLRFFNLHLEQSRFIREINKFVQLTEANTKDCLLAAMQDATEFCARYTYPFAGWKNIPVKRYKREVLQLISRKRKNLFCVVIKRRGQKKQTFFANSARKLAKYRDVTYRGLGRSGWFLNQQSSTGIPLTPAEQRILDKSPALKSLRNSNEIITTIKDEITIRNKTPGIERYAQMAEAQGTRAAALKMARKRREHLEKMEKEIKL